MKFLCGIALIALPAFTFYCWLLLDSETFLSLLQESIPIQTQYIGLSNRLLALVPGLIPIALLMRGAWHLRRLFGLFAVRAFFHEEIAQRLHGFAFMLVFSVLAKPVAGALSSAALTMNYPEGERSISVTIESGDLTTLFIGVIFLIIAWVLREAHQLSKENAEIV